ncbi:PglL family O-oligosaccharyltransferase [Neisseria animalis]|uniref:Polymerase n=1 Tax=Neisseria animalis TaxID=492 RepID=A0A5P3MPX8_NEIAN|nr:Wzy polymerase domain-containing protein [Neisseria animalis]QEY23622.1 polymerase [Neisseria animalis]ROW32767.1 polymerase [Neisseria animalis]VEE09355.1 integral membrane protein [Neisseria animalis]
MYPHFTDGPASEWSRRLIPLWVCFLWISVAPFLSLYRVGPLSSFYLEAGSLSGAVFLVLATAYLGLLNVRPSAASVGFLLLAAFWWIQARVLNLTYPGMNDMVVWTFIILALTAWACRAWVAGYGQERVTAVLAWSILAGALLQALIAFMQFKGWAGAEWFHGILAVGGKDGINGQLGQRNHLGHYLMWGVLAAAWLWGMRKMPAWAGLLLLLLLTAVLGLVNSRTIFIYLLGVGALLAVWRLSGGHETARLVRTMLLALILVALFQFGMSPLLEWLGSDGYQTAAERVASSGFQGSARDVEWRKAWAAFQSAPLLGHGWNSFAQQSFLIHAETRTFSNNIISVLFTHSHNLILQLLAEVGIFGTLLAAFCLLAAVWRMLRRPLQPASLLLLALMTVTLCHSMLEYPLWYIYFLTPFALMLSLSPARHTDFADGLRTAKRFNLTAGILSLLLIGGIARLGWHYTELAEYNRKPANETASENARKIEGLRRIAAAEPMLRYYAELSLSRRADPSAATVFPWAEQAAINALSYRPYANAYQVGLYLYRKGETERAEKWMQAMYYYYPYQMPFYAGKIRANAALQPLLPQLLADCQTFAATPNRPQAKHCGR